MVGRGVILPGDRGEEAELRFLERFPRTEFGFEADGVRAGMGEDRISHGKLAKRKSLTPGNYAPAAPNVSHCAGSPVSSPCFSQC